MAAAKKASKTIVFSHWFRLIENLQSSSMDFYARVEKALERRQVPKLIAARVDWREGGFLSAKREYLRLTRERLTFDVCGAPFGTGFFVSWRFGEKPLKFRPLLLLIVAALLAASAYWMSDWVVVIGFWLIRNVAHLRSYDRNQALLVGLSALIMPALLVAWPLRRLVGRGLTDLDSLIMQIPLLGPFYERFFRELTYYRVDLMLMYQEAVHAAVTEIIDEISKSQGIQPLSEFERRPILRELFPN